MASSIAVNLVAQIVDADVLSVSPGNSATRLVLPSAAFRMWILFDIQMTGVWQSDLTFEFPDPAITSHSMWMPESSRSMPLSTQIGISVSLLR
ncbi:hypothetical protein SBP18_11565 [Rhodoferax ferrireducens]|uniref:hypothetical protein n=1 Tax=Rhodoferax ferrireducens TaxID=192843 RepID=UPI00298DFC8A|nr:hypothetical protein [Rhodoferax ferrireducens]WPC65146.1 hypothetical protein SBP18_11565 [Rhodoferax ferrireducens]